MVRLGNRGWPSISAPSASQFCGKAVDENHALGIADIQDGHLLRARLQGDVAADLASRRTPASPCSFRTRNWRPSRRSKRRCLGPAPVWMVTCSPRWPESISKRGRAARTVARHLGLAAVGVEQANGACRGSGSSRRRRCRCGDRRWRAPWRPGRPREPGPPSVSRKSFPAPCALVKGMVMMSVALVDFDHRSAFDFNRLYQMIARAGFERRL